MCGISVIISTTPRSGIPIDDPPSDREETRDAITQKMRASLDLMKHRGPDATGVWMNQNQRVVLGHNRLAINDLSPSANQPLHSPDGTIHAVVNGEFYDFETTKSTLSRTTGYQFSSNSDSELVIALYQAYGIEGNFFQYLRGEFSFCLYDSSKDLVVAARDRFGIKPLFYTTTLQDTDGKDERLFLASEIKAFLPLGWQPEWDVPSLVESGWHLDDRTCFKGVKKLRPGCYMVCDLSAGDIQQHRYWDIDFPNKNTKDQRTEQEIFQGVRERLMEAARVRLQADVPVGIYLSGGIDSSIMAGLATHFSKEKGIRIGSLPPEDRVNCFTVAFDKSSGFDESDVAQRTADHLGVKLHKLHMDEEAIAADFEESTWHGEHPTPDVNFIGKFALSKATRDLGVKVVLTGEGADEHFTGYPMFLPDLLREPDASWESTVSEEERLLLSDKAEREMVTWRRLINTNNDFVEDAPEGRRRLNGVTAGAAMTTSRVDVFVDWAKTDQSYDLEGVTANYVEPAALARIQEKWHPVNAAQYLWAKGFLQNLLLSSNGDRTEMSHSVEGRPAFLDHHLTEYVNNIPPSLRVKWDGSSGQFVEKYALREAMRPFLTEEVYGRKKQSYLAPILYPSDGPLHRLLTRLLSRENIENLGFVAWDKVEGILERGFVRQEAAAARIAVIVAQWVVLAQRFGIKTAVPE